MSTPKDRIYSRDSVNPRLSDDEPQIPARQKRSITSNQEDAKTHNQHQAASLAVQKQPPSSSAAHSDVGGANLKRYETLMRKHQELSHSRIRYSTMLEEVTKKIDQYEAEARKQFGVSSLEELEQLVIRLQKEEDQALDQFERDLRDQELLLSQIERDLNSIQ